jgi:uridine kinase
MVHAPPPVIIGISGGTGSGKTTVANVILSRADADDITVMAHDAYYRNLNHLPFEERKKINFDHPDSLETELLIHHLQQLRSWQPVEVPVYDFTTHTRTKQTRHVDPRPIILVDGILIFVEPKLRDLFDVKIFVDTPADVRFIRRLQRDMEYRGRTLESVIEQYQLTVRPMHEEFVEPSKRYADVIIPEGGLNTVAMDMVVARIRALLASAER